MYGSVKFKGKTIFKKREKNVHRSYGDEKFKSNFYLSVYWWDDDAFLGNGVSFILENIPFYLIGWYSTISINKFIIY